MSYKTEIKACLFDLDGVIVDTAKYHYVAWKKIADELGFFFSEADNERLKGVSRMQSLDILLEVGNKELDEQTKLALAERKNAIYVDYVTRMNEDEILPGVTRFLDELRANGILIALGSASKNAPMILERIGLIEKFDAIIDGNKVANAKPDPEVFLKGAQVLGVDPKNCLVFEDAQAGIEAALNGKMKVIGVGHEENLKGANYLIEGFQEMNIQKIVQLFPAEQ